MNLVAEKLIDLFTSLNFDVRPYRDLTAHQMFATIRDVGAADHSKADCIIVCILTHGSRVGVHGVDDKHVNVDKLSGLLNGLACPSLIGKPKLFFIQACKGTDEMAASQEERDGPSLHDPISKPTEADFCLSYSTVPGYVSWRSTTEGSYYINILVKNILAYSDQEELLSILTNVNKEVGDKLGTQCTYLESTLSKKFYFNK
ncbi:caspase-3-like [Saccoglossus kowalevskii]